MTLLQSWLQVSGQPIPYERVIIGPWEVLDIVI